MANKKYRIFLILSLFLLSLCQDDLFIDPGDISEVIEIPKTPEIAYIEDNEDFNNDCNPELPNLTVGDYFIDSQEFNLTSFKGKQKVFILGISDSMCEN